MRGYRDGGFTVAGREQAGGVTSHRESLAGFRLALQVHGKSMSAIHQIRRQLYVDLAWRYEEQGNYLAAHPDTDVFERLCQLTRRSGCYVRRQVHAVDRHGRPTRDGVEARLRGAVLNTVGSDVGNRIQLGNHVTRSVHGQ